MPTRLSPLMVVLDKGILICGGFTSKREAHYYQDYRGERHYEDASYSLAKGGALFDPFSKKIRYTAQAWLGAGMSTSNVSYMTTD